MKWLSGSSAVLVLALFVALTSPSAPGQAPASPSRAGANGQPASAALELMTVNCADVDSLARKGLDSAISDSANAVPSAGPRSVEFVIALVPDPAHTHLSLFFDRAVEALELGVQGEGWEYDRTTLPWDNVSHSESSDFRVRSKESEWASCRERYPGVMVFRRTWEAGSGGGGPMSRRLLVFLVGETPTGGIRRIQFENALAVVRAQGEAGVRVVSDVLRVVGPTFSGSLPSLANLLTDPKVTQGRPVRVRSGSVSSKTGIDHFRKSFPGPPDFTSAVATDDFLLGALRKFVDPLGYKPESIAILSEDETAYGAQSSGAAITGAVELYYPRGISHIRRAYQNDELFDQSNDQRSRAQPRTTLRLNLADTGQDGDSVPPFSAQLPVSQETALQGVVGELQAHHTSLVVVRATDPLDQLFLSRYLHRAYPSGRLVMLSTDRLFAREEVDDPQFRGDLALSTYSMLPRREAAGHVTLTGADFHAVFPSDFSNGAYCAVRAMFTSGRREGCLVEENGGGNLEVIGAGGYWPLTTFDRDGDSDKGDRSHRDGTAQPAGSAQPVRPYLPRTWLLFCACVMIAVFAHITMVTRGTLMSRFESIARFSPADDRKRAILAGLASAIVLMLLWIMIVPALHAESGITRATKLVDSRMLLGSWPVLAGLALMLLAVTAWDLQRRFREWPTGVIVRTALIVIAVFYACFQTFSVLDAGLDLPGTIYRTLHLESGLSPLLPLAWLAVGGYWCILQGLSGIALVDPRRPRLPEFDDTREAVVGIDADARRESLAKSDNLRLITDADNAAILDDSQPLSWNWAIGAVVGAAALLTLAGLDLRHPFSTLEGRLYDRFYAVVVVLVVGSILTSLVRCLKVWKGLQRLLVALERTPLRRGFTHLKGYSWQPMWRPGGSTVRATARGFAQIVESLEHLRNRLVVGAPHGHDALLTSVNAALAQRQAMESHLAAIRGRQARRLCGYLAKDDCHVLNEFRKMQECVAKVAANALGVYLAHASYEDMTLVMDGDHRPEAKKDEPPDPQRQLLTQLEEFLCLVYSSFITNTLGRIRTLVAAVGGLFVTMSLSFVSYPFTQQSALGSTGIVLFLLTLAVIGLVYAEMHRDATLSRLADTTPNELGADFWLKMGGFAAVPVLSIISVQWPGLGRALFSWIAPFLGK